MPPRRRSAAARRPPAAARRSASRTPPSAATTAPSSGRAAVGARTSGPIAQAGKANLNILQGGFPLDVANRAYVVYCAHVTPTEPMDDAAFGDLNLYSADIAFDDSHAVDKNNPVEGRVAACDQSIKARLSLEYIGKGTVTVTWKVGDVVVGGVTDYEIGPSPSRNADRAQGPGAAE